MALFSSPDKLTSSYSQLPALAIPSSVSSKSSVSPPVSGMIFHKRLENSVLHVFVPWYLSYTWWYLGLSTWFCILGLLLVELRRPYGMLGHETGWVSNIS